MKFDFDNPEKPLFLQIAEQLEDGILEGIYGEEEQIPSSTEISVTYRINPATVNKGVGLLAADNIVYKKRGIGMFVSIGAKAAIAKKRQGGFKEQFVLPLLEEAKRLDISPEELVEMIKNS